MYHYLTIVEEYPPGQARSPIFDRWQIERQWQAIMDLSPADLGC